jgi:hypothetical protein
LRCAIGGEIKKERYVYYHYTGYADKCRGNPTTCREHMREEALLALATIHAATLAHRRSRRSLGFANSALARLRIGRARVAGSRRNRGIEAVAGGLA